MIPNKLYAICDRDSNIKLFTEYIDDAVKLSCKLGFYHLIHLDIKSGRILEKMSTDDIIFHKFCEIRHDLKKRYIFPDEQILDCETIVKTANYYNIDTYEVRYAILNINDRIYG